MSNSILGQQLFFRHYTPDDGLPTVSLYNISEDQDGFMWITSEAEVCRFDGQRFQPSPIDGLEQKEVIKLDFQSPDRLVFIDLMNQIFIYENDSLRRLDFPLYPKSPYLCGFYEDNNNQNWLVCGGVDYIFSMPKEEIFDTSRHKIYHHPTFTQPKAFYAASKDTVYLFGQNSTVKIINDLIYYTPNSVREHLMPPSVEMPNKNDVLLSTFTGNLLFYSKKDDQFRPAFTEYDSLIQAGLNYIFKDHLQNIWVSTRNGLIFLDYQEDGSYKMNHYLAGVNVGIVWENDKHQYWITSLTDGLYFLPSLELSSYIHPKFQKTSVITIDRFDNILIGTDDGWILTLDKDFELQKESKLQRQSIRIYDIDTSYDTMLFATSLQISSRNLEGDFHTLKLGSFKQLCRSSEDVVWFGSSSVMGYYDRRHKSIKDIEILKNIRTYAVNPISDTECYFGAIDGLYHYKNDTLRTVLADEIQSDIRDIEIFEDSTILLATQGNGLFHINHDSVIQHITVDDGLVSNHCTNLLLGNKYTWLATNKGVHRIDFEGNEIKLLSKSNGLMDENINCLALKGDTILVGTNKGVVYFKEDYLLDETPPDVYLSSVKISEKDTSILESYFLEHFQNNIKIGFSSIQFTNEESITYEYKLKGLNDKWLTTSINEAQYPSLIHGDYEFILRAKTINSDWSPVITLPFKIAKPIWKRWWFITICVLLIGTIVYLRLLQYIKNKARKAKIDAQIKETQLMALRSQMNPHFIFNSLNSIQEFIILQDKRTANRYLGQFSLLMRTILNMSEKETITLRQEVDALELYLSLESMRFEEELGYTILCDPLIKLEQTQFPPMLIQPYVENAILHGLRHKNGIKKLDIEFILESSFLKCIITDNGIGRAKAKAIKARKKAVFPSKGMNITEKRIRLLNDTYHQGLKIDILDLENDQKEALGTKVIIQILLETSKMPPIQ